MMDHKNDRCRTCGGPMDEHISILRFDPRDGECGKCRAAAHEASKARQSERRRKAHPGATWRTILSSVLAALALAGAADAQLVGERIAATCPNARTLYIGSGLVPSLCANWQDCSSPFNPAGTTYLSRRGHPEEASKGGRSGEACGLDLSPGGPVHKRFGLPPGYRITPLDLDDLRLTSCAGQKTICHELRAPVVEPGCTVTGWIGPPLPWAWTECRRIYPATYWTDAGCCGADHPSRGKLCSDHPTCRESAGAGPPPPPPPVTCPDGTCSPAERADGSCPADCPVEPPVEPPGPCQPPLELASHLAAVEAAAAALDAKIEALRRFVEQWATTGPASTGATESGLRSEQP